MISVFGLVVIFSFKVWFNFCNLYVMVIVPSWSFLITCLSIIFTSAPKSLVCKILSSATSEAKVVCLLIFESKW
ncbi:hypothetical protein HLA92_01480 [Mycoplasma miroungirhinis]|uniref:Uncharacterized protein n=1 Tax=Mycoplasma miroungirhinis TaxID=754516 RepID=A0A6M4JAT2_9MOLU|nr:hypothetical protein [Mycoplasma miroungirhinis]QJR44104.1 hypothetical protein HLA92_01480 [Mycoplasma miroungirhinis]